MAKNKKFLQKAVKHPGAFTAWCKAHGFSSVDERCIAFAKATAKKTGNTTLMRRANFAKTAQKGF